MHTDKDATRRALQRAVDFLLRWQLGVETHVEDYWSAQTGWVQRPVFGWAAGSFAGDWFRNGPSDAGGDRWRMGMGITWHCGQAVWALVRAARHDDSPRLRRAVAEGARFLCRMQLLDGRHVGALYTPPHSLPPLCRQQMPDIRLYRMPGRYDPPGNLIINSDMCEAVGGLLAAGQFLDDPIALDAARRWGDWHCREADIPPGDDQYHQFDVDTGEKGHVRDFGGRSAQPNRLWTMDDGVQGLLGVAFDEPRWIERYLLKVEAFLRRRFDIREMPTQQGRSFYWDSSLLHPILRRQIHGPFDRAVAKFTEYVEGALRPRGSDGMMPLGVDSEGRPNPMSGGDGAATVMAARMCLLLHRATGDRRYRDEAQPMLRWAIENQFPDDAPDRMAGGIPFCRWQRMSPGGEAFDFKRIISTVFAAQAFCDWLETA